MKPILLTLLLSMGLTAAYAQREKTLIDEGWRFAFGSAADPQKDFGRGTEYFNYMTKASSIHNEGPYCTKFDDSEWTEVSIPHDWVTTLPYAAEASHSHGYKTVGWKYPDTSVGWYRKTITIPAEDLGRQISLQFDGIFRNAEVWMNGFFLGSEPSGYATQVYDVSEYVNYGGENLICVRADASLEEGWFYEGAGIYRDAWLVKTGTLHVSPFGMFAYSDLNDDFTQATIHIETEVENSAAKGQAFSLSYAVIDADGNTVSEYDGMGKGNLPGKGHDTYRQTLTVTTPHLWDVTSPYLYTVKAIVKGADGTVSDVYSQRIGIRRAEFRADTGFWLNGRNIKLKGVNMHQDHAGVGSAILPALDRWRIKQLKSFGCNAYRASHNPMSPALLDICDEEGILVIDENRLAGINDYHRRQLEMMIRRDRNHPSIILWSDGNEEWALENSVIGTRIAEGMREMTARLDPSRPSCMANAGGYELIKGCDVVGYNYIIQNDVMNRHEAHPEWKIVGTEETTGCGTRGFYFNDKNEPRYITSLNRVPLKDWQAVYDEGLTAQTPDSYTQGIERGWKFYRDTPWAAGVFYWTGFDYRGEPSPLTFPSHDSEFGILDYAGFWKDEAYYLKAAWTDNDVLHVLPHWNLTGHEGEETDIWVYGNMDEVSLTVNGKNLGRKKMPKDGHLTWKATYKPGRVVATGYKNGRKVKTETIETTGAATAIVATADRTEYAADGRDVCVVQISLQDAKGRFVPDACNDLTFTVNGEARIIGAGNGDPGQMVLDNPCDQHCQQFTYPAFNGHAALIVQTSKTAGDIVITAEGKGLKTSTVKVTSAL